MVEKLKFLFIKKVTMTSKFHDEWTIYIYIQSTLVNTNTDKEYNRIRSTSFDSPT